MLNTNSKNERIMLLYEKIDEIISQLKYPEICGYMFFIFETDGKEIYTIADSEGFISPEDIMMFLKHLKIIKKVVEGKYYQPYKFE